MKKLFRASAGCTTKILTTFKLSKRSFLFYLSFLLCAFLFVGCEKQDIKAPEKEIEPVSKKTEPVSKKKEIMNTDAEFRNNHSRLGLLTLWELLQARLATAKYRNINKAIQDGYVDISVVVPNMGHHYRKLSLVDGTFEVRKPEILVYHKHEDGEFELVAVEYAIPIEDSPNAAPQGFTGSADVWDRNTGFDLWLLHAWVWHYNPDGVFNPTNPLIHQH
jgi:hypothetical protein